MPADRLLDVTDVAARINRGVMAVYRRIWAGQIEAVDMRLPGASKARYQIRESALTAYLDRNTIRQPARRVA